MVTGKVDYYACFHDLQDGIQTHCFAPMGLDIRSRWRVAGNLPGEPRETAELGIGIPKDGLYIREDVTMKCNIMLTSFVKKTFKKAHERLVDRLGERTHVVDTEKHNTQTRMRMSNQYGASSTAGSSTPPTPSYTAPGSPPLPSVSPRFSAMSAPRRPESPASYHTGVGSHYSGPSPYASPNIAAQMAAQGLDLNNPAHHAYVSPLYHQMDPAYRAANPYENPPQAPCSNSMQHLPYDPAQQVHGDPKMAYQNPHHMGGYYPPPQPGPAPQYNQSQLHPGAVEIASSELRHPAVRAEAPPLPEKIPHAPAEMEG